MTKVRFPDWDSIPTLESILAGKPSKQEQDEHKSKRNREYCKRYRVEHAELKRQKDREYRTTDKGKSVHVAGERRRREAKVAATNRYADLTYLDNGCSVCGTLVGPFHVDHVWPLSRIGEMPEDFTSGLRILCAACNLSKNDRDPAEFFLARWRAGLSIIQTTVPLGLLTPWDVECMSLAA